MSPYWEVRLKYTRCIKPLLSHSHFLCFAITKLVYLPLTPLSLHPLSENGVKQTECTQRLAYE